MFFAISKDLSKSINLMLSHLFFKISIIRLKMPVDEQHFPINYLQFNKINSSIYKSIQSKYQYSFLQTPYLPLYLFLFYENVWAHFFLKASKIKKAKIANYLNKITHFLSTFQQFQNKIFLQLTAQQSLSILCL